MRNVALTVILVTALTGCASTNAFVRMTPDYTALPREALEDVALRIEQAVARGDREAEIKGTGGIVLDTPEIRQAIRNRAARHALLSEFLDTGYLYEKRSGLVYIQRNSTYKKNTTRAERDRHALLVMGENANRWSIYEGIVKAGNFPPNALSAVQETFFKARLSLMKPSQRYENESGEMVAK